MVQPIADKVALNLEIIVDTFSTNQNSAYGIYELYQVVNEKSHENPGTPGNKMQKNRNNLQIPCHPISNWLYQNNDNLSCWILSFGLRFVTVVNFPLRGPYGGPTT